MKTKWIVAGIASAGLIASAAAFSVSRPASAPQAPAPKREILLAPPAATNADVALLTQATRTTPGSAAAWVALGNAQLRARAFPAAIAAYDKALAIDPNRSETWSALGEAHIQTGRSESFAMPALAKAAFERALAIDPRDLRARFYTTMERDFAGEHDRAIGEWLALLREAPMGSDADEAIRAAMAASINRNLAQIKAAMAKATQVQPRVAGTTKG